MHRYLFLALALVLTACPSVQILEPAHDMAMENVKNLEANITETLKHYETLAKSHPDFEEDKDLQGLMDRINTVQEQMAIMTLYVLVVDQAVKGTQIDKEAFFKFLGEVPRLIEEGKIVWAEIEALIKGGE